MSDEKTSTAAIDDALIDDSPDVTAADQSLLDEPEPEVSPVTYTGTDFDVEGLVRRLDRGDIVIPNFGHADDSIETAGFQRGFVWNRSQMDRFIESLLLGFPIPGIMLVQQQDKRYLVLDGQQRLTTMQAFYRGVHQGKEFALKNVSLPFRDLTYRSLSPEQRRHLDNAFIQATIVKTDGSPDSLDAVYQVFERLNSGGTQLTPHEIRIALFAGPIVTYLDGLNHHESWRQLYGPISPRLRDQELILRVLAFYVSASVYRRPLKKFLNDFMGEHRTLDRLQADELGQLFKAASDLLLQGPGRSALRRSGNQINAALTDALFVGLMRRLESGRPISPETVAGVVDSLEANDELLASIARSTADEETVRTRLSIATAGFAAA
jgi:hypothetical protein